MAAMAIQIRTSLDEPDTGAAFVPHRPRRPEKTEAARPLRVVSDYQPAGDQPAAIAELVDQVKADEKTQVLLGVTGSGKTFTMAKVIEALQRPALVLAPNKILAAQLYGEFKSFFPDNAVEYFVSYYDYYQPEAYVPRSDTAGTVVWQSGFPIGVSGASSGAALTRPDRVDGVPIELPEELQGWYDGRTQVTLPSGRVITPPNNTYLKYNPDAFAGRVITTPDGSVVPDVFWFGNARPTYNEFRTDARFNIDLSVRRTFRIQGGPQFEIGADIMNLLNTAQFNGSYSGNLGSTNTRTDPSRGLVPGMGSSESFGTRGLSTFNPRQIMLRAGLHF